MAFDKAKLDDFVGKVVGDLSAGYGGVMVSLGDKLGLYKALAGKGPTTSTELADRTGCAERYLREWLNAQAAGGYVIYHPSSESYELTAEQAMVLADEHSPVFIPPAWQVPASMWFDEDKALTAFRTGQGVSWFDHDTRLYCGVAAFYRNAYRGSLVADWLPSLDGVVEKLQTGAKVADVGCGHGHSTIIMAEAYPHSQFWGFDPHLGSVEAARNNAREAGVDDRVVFSVEHAQSYPSRDYDLICFFDCLHDLGDPVRAAERAETALTDNGSVMVVEPFAHDRTEDNFNTVGRLYYAASSTVCCAHALSEGGFNVLGAQAGEKRLSEVFTAAGFAYFHRTFETPFNLIFEARR